MAERKKERKKENLADSTNKSQLVFLGSLYGMGTSFAGAVWDKDFCCPTIMTCQGGGREPHIIIKV